LNLLAASFVCFGINNDELLSHNGFSFYGNFLETVIPYSIGLGVSAWLLLRAANEIVGGGRDANLLRASLRVSAVALLGLMLTPSFANKLTAVAHVAFGCVLYCTQVFVAWELFRKWWSNPLDRTLLILQFVAVAIISLSFSQIGVLDLMIPAQIAELVGFGVLCIRAISRLEPVQGSSSTFELADKV
jgi:hypothetical protein